MNTNELRMWIVEHRVEARSREGFWIALNNYKEESTEEFNRYFESFDELHLDIRIEQFALMLSSPPDYPDIHVISYIPIIYRGTTIGLYRLLFTLDGAEYDDYFTLY